MGKSKREDEELKKLKKLKKLLGEDKLRQELEKISGKRERKKSKKKSRHSSEEEGVWEERTFTEKSGNKDSSDNQHKNEREDKLQWMYKGADDLVDAEDYLLGKKVDQAIVRKQRGEKDEKSQEASSSVGAIFDNSASTQAVDMANKLREDPLFMIKQQELNKKKDLLNNPVRMKQLQELLQKSKQSKKKKKEKKQKKKQRQESSSDDSSHSDSDDVKVHKLQGYGFISSKKLKRSPESKHSRHEGRNRGSSPNRRQDNYYSYRNRDSYRHRSPVRRQRSMSPNRSYSGGRRSRSPRNRSSGSTKKMDDKELERRRAEMMENAKSRDKDRRSRVQRYRDEDRAEKEAETNKSRNAEFIEPMKLSATSVEDRIKRNIYNIQRTSVALDKNFAKR
ncbi:pre-mRNA-splicing factor CWC25 homolog [Anneissia japonica]|uniref:pre-mRNA-splicing factor CWC25 homolog n=1 Tax=Anneissia japonica TaxID=1529436 RepID=UPI001425AF4F|nr:pre-mRNA-splicing factor CWC25 homolog [Anneissia japonica]